MKLKEQIKIGWSFIAAVVIYIPLVIFSTSGLSDMSDILFGTAYILLAATVTYTCYKAVKRFQKNGKYGSCARLLYAAWLLSGLWLYEAIQILILNNVRDLSDRQILSGNLFFLNCLCYNRL